MANFETNSYIRVKDADGDIHVVYPITKAENVEGLENFKKVTCKYDPVTKTLNLSNITNVDDLANAVCVITGLTDDAGNLYKVNIPEIKMASTSEAGLVQLGEGFIIGTDGRIKVDKNVLEQYCFPITAGRDYPIQGELYTSGGIRNTTDNDYLAIYGGSDASKGAVLQLYGVNSDTNPGAFQIASFKDNGDGAFNRYWLKGDANGNLTWNGKAFSYEGHTHSQYLTRADMPAVLDGYVDSSQLTNTLKNYVTNSNLPTAITNAIKNTEFEDITCRNLTVNNDASLTDLTVTGDTLCKTITADKVYGAVYNDYAEFLPRGEETEAGDIIMLDMNSEEEKYVKAVKGTDVRIAGVHSDEFSHIIGGEQPKGCKSYIAYNLPKYIPCGMVGRCHIKITGPAIKGANVILTDIPGVGRCAKTKTDAKLPSIGYLVETDDIQDGTIRRLKVRLKL